MSAYLIDNPPRVQQFYRTRNRPLTGCTVLHTAESVMDTIGPDTGAEAVANFIRTRTTAGSYHDLVDSDSIVNLVPYESGAFHDGTGSNNWALSISFACSTSDWRRMTPEKRAAFLRNGARAFVAQQAWRRAHGYPTTDLRRITKAESDRGVSGFIYHGDRDPGRRTDPGKNPPDLFPIDEFIDHCRVALGGAASTAAQSEEDDVTFVSVKPSDHITIPRPRGGDVVIDLAFDDSGLGYNGKAAEQLVRVAALGKDGTWRSFYKSMEGHDGFTFWVPTAASVAIPLAADDVMCVIRNLHPAWNLGVAINRTA